MTALGDLATSALAHDAVASLGGIETYVAEHGPSPEVDAVRAFIQVLSCEFDNASSWTPDDEQPLNAAVGEFVSAVCLAQVPSLRGAPDLRSETLGLETFVIVEAAMSAGQ